MLDLQGNRRKLTFKEAIRKHYGIYLLLLPTMIYFIVFAYVPYFGLQIAFKDFKIFQGMLASPWVGFAHFRNFFADYCVTLYLLVLIVLFSDFPYRLYSPFS